MSTATATKSATKRAASLKSLLIAGLIGGAIATVLNAVIFLIAQAASEGPLLMTMAGSTTAEPLTLAMVVFMSLMPGVAAGAAFWGLSRATRNPRRWFVVLAGVVYLGFAFGPFSVASDGATLAILELMHVAAAAPILWSVLRAARLGSARGRVRPGEGTRHRAGRQELPWKRRL